MNFNYFSGLFSSLGSSSTNTLYGSLGEYTSIKSGSYKKLLRQYYSDSDNKSTNAAKNILKTNTQAKDKTLTSVKSSSDELVKSATALYTKGKNSVFASGKSEDMVKGVKEFVSDYNKLIDDTKSSTTKNITTTAGYLTGTMKTYSKSLESIGITIDSENNKLKIDETKLNAADVSKVKDIFSGTSSLAFQVANKATSIGTYAKSEALTTDTSSFNQYW